MALGDFLNTALSPVTALMGGLTGAGALTDAQNLQNQATQDAILAQQQQFQQQMAALQPYQTYGVGGLRQIQGSLGPESQLGMMRTNLGQQNLPQMLANTGFDAGVIDELMGRYNTTVGAQENTARRNRAQDIANMGMGIVGPSVGMMGQQGRGLSDIYMQGAQQQGQLAQQQALAQQNAAGVGIYGGYRGLLNYLGGAYA